MKKTVFPVLLMYGLFSNTLLASTYRVNNNLADNPSAGIFSGIREAHDAASAGDTLIIAGSSEYYDTLTCTKRLFIKGPGYFLDENPGRSINKLSAKVYCIYFNSGSEGTVVTGLELPLGAFINDNYITVQRCRSGHIEIADSIENTTIKGCYFNDWNDFNTYHFDFSVKNADIHINIRFGKHVTGLVVSNCILNGVASAGGCFGDDHPSALFINNLIRDRYYCLDMPIGWKNNIQEFSTGFYTRFPYGADVCCNVYSSGTFAEDTTLFSGGESPDGRWMNKAGSPAIGAGEGGVDCGPFGGPHPYALSGIDPDSGLVAYYPFSGNAGDESGNGHTGLVHGARLTADRFGNTNSAYWFNGTDNYIELAQTKSLNMFSGFSLVAWVNFTNSNGSSIISKHINYYYNGFTMSAFNNHVNLATNNNQYYLATSETYNDGKWHLFVGTLDDTTMSVYVDGYLKKTGYADYSIGNCMNIRIGADSILSFFNGKIDDVRIYDRTLSKDEIRDLYHEYRMMTVTTPDIVSEINRVFVVPVTASDLKSGHNNCSYQFELQYNGELLQFQQCSMEGTLSSGGSLQVNPLPNKLEVAWAGPVPLADSGILLEFTFKALQRGYSTPVFSNFLMNTDTVRNLTCGSITIIPEFGDADGNENIQAYDAALALQYSVGLDPLPETDPLPWEDWRMTSANVDGQGTISAYDASLILQYIVGLIDSFPASENQDSLKIPLADVSVTAENGYIVFRSGGNLYGLNIAIANPEIPGAPEVSDQDMLLSENISSSGYYVGLATANPPAVNDVFLKIPLPDTLFQPATLNLIINNRPEQVILGQPTGVSDVADRSTEIYPNPAGTMLYFRNLTGNAKISIYDMHGRELVSGVITDNQVDISGLEYGIYTIRIEEDETTVTRKLIKQ
jgi:hypothetical protein